MFDIGFSELVVIAVVALVVLGPERLPRAARFAGLWVRRARAQWYSVKTELERELAAEDLKRSVHEATAGLREVDTQLRAAGHEVQQQIESVREEARSGAIPPTSRLAALHPSPADDEAPSPPLGPDTPPAPPREGPP